MPPAHPTSQPTHRIASRLSHIHSAVSTHSLVCLCGVADGFCLWPLVRSSDACAAGLLLALQPLDHPTKRAHNRIASSLSHTQVSACSLVIVCGVAGLVAVWLSENYHSRLHTSTQPCYMYRTPSPIQTCMARTHTHSTLALVSQCHHPCYHALLVRGGTLRDTTEGSVAPRPCARTLHGSTPRGATGVDVLSRPHVFMLA